MCQVCFTFFTFVKEGRGVDVTFGVKSDQRQMLRMSLCSPKVTKGRCPLDVTFVTKSTDALHIKPPSAEGGGKNL